MAKIKSLIRKIPFTSILIKSVPFIINILICLINYNFNVSIPFV